MDILALSMKAVTFVGVLVAATGMNLPTSSARGFAARVALGVGGVALMIGNVWLAAIPFAIAIDVAYVVVCGFVLAHALRASPEAGPVEFQVLGDAA